MLIVKSYIYSKIDIEYTGGELYAMDIKQLQNMINTQALSILSSNSGFSHHSPIVDLAFKQVLENRLRQMASAEETQPRVAQPISQSTPVGQKSAATPIDTYV